MEVVWICPQCGMQNVDNFLETMIPFCGECSIEVLWEDILTEEELQIADQIMEEEETDEQSI